MRVRCLSDHSMKEYVVEFNANTKFVMVVKGESEEEVFNKINNRELYSDDVSMMQIVQMDEIENLGVSNAII